MSTEAPSKNSRKGRPNNPIEFRRQLAQRACEPGVSVARLALEHGLNTNLLFKWRRAYRAGEYDGGALIPVAVLGEDSQPNSRTPATAPGVIEISIGAARVRIEGMPDAAALRLVLNTLATAKTKP
ncbi:IS66 family insertion sequence hypothetical protein [Pararobbsia silviterrae]|uniref:Transposase n=1 Tax=Pararobbsia silviterrae TaxID=1792498 RepID=A0A494X5H8_9BURK|nr:IS66 family insertion sequence hypothetical protein [Pararobbsia silviterrae]